MAQKKIHAWDGFMFSDTPQRPTKCDRFAPPHRATQNIREVTCKACAKKMGALGNLTRAFETPETPPWKCKRIFARGNKVFIF